MILLISNAVGVGGFTGDVNIAVTEIPTGFELSGLSPTKITLGSSGTATFLLYNGGPAPSGTYHATVTGTSGSITKSVPVTLVVP